MDRHRVSQKPSWYAVSVHTSGWRGPSGRAAGWHAFSWLAWALSLQMLWPPASLAVSSEWQQAFEMGKTRYLQNDYKAAEEELTRALIFAKDLGVSDPRLAETYSQFGQLYEKQEQYDRAASMLDQAIDLRRAQSDDEGLRSDLELYADVEEQLGNQEKAETARAEARKLRQAERDTTSSANYESPKEQLSELTSKAESALMTGDDEEAARQVLNALRERARDEENDARPLSTFETTVDRLVNDHKRPQALALCDDGLAIVRGQRGSLHAEVAQLLKKRIEVLNAMGKSAEANTDFQKYNAMQASLRQKTLQAEVQRNHHSHFSEEEPKLSSAGPTYNFFNIAPSNDRMVYRNRTTATRFGGMETFCSSTQVSSESFALQQDILQLEEQEMQALESRQRAAQSMSRWRRGFGGGW